MQDRHQCAPPSALPEHSHVILSLSSNDMARLHIRHMVGGRADVENERILRFEFPERPGALLRFLRGMNQVVFRMLSVRRYLRCSVQPGSDTRVILHYTDEETSPALADAVIAGITAAGCEVLISLNRLTLWRGECRLLKLVEPIDDDTTHFLGH